MSHMNIRGTITNQQLPGLDIPVNIHWTQTGDTFVVSASKIVVTASGATVKGDDFPCQGFGEWDKAIQSLVVKLGKHLNFTPGKISIPRPQAARVAKPIETPPPEVPAEPPVTIPEAIASLSNGRETVRFKDLADYSAEISWAAVPGGFYNIQGVLHHRDLKVKEVTGFKKGLDAAKQHISGLLVDAVKEHSHKPAVEFTQPPTTTAANNGPHQQLIEELQTISKQLSTTAPRQKEVKRKITSVVEALGKGDIPLIQAAYSSLCDAIGTLGWDAMPQTTGATLTKLESLFEKVARPRSPITTAR